MNDLRLNILNKMFNETKSESRLYEVIFDSSFDREKKKTMISKIKDKQIIEFDFRNDIFQTESGIYGFNKAKLLRIGYVDNDHNKKRIVIYKIPYFTTKKRVKALKKRNIP